MLETIAHYRILRRLGSGGMGEVFLAEDTRLQRQVAIKLLPEGSALNPSYKRRLVREAQAAAKLDHPNACAIFEVGETEAGSYIVMQYVDGATLGDRLQNWRPNLEELLDIGVQVADALAEAHRRGIVHRDIKPQNIMITPRGQAKVLDFGLAKELMGGHTAWDDASTLLTNPGMVVGTVPYMSPEQVKGEDLDGRSDIFSLGAVIYEAATGGRPFQAKSGAELMSAILVAQPALLEDSSSELHPELRRILRKALAKDREHRYDTADQMEADLRRLREGLSRGVLQLPLPAFLPQQAPVPSAPTGRASRVTVASQVPEPPPPPRRRWPFVLGFLLLLGALGAGAYYWMRPASTAIDSIAVLPLSNTGNDPDLDYVSDGLTESLIDQLSHIPGLKVIARGSVMRYKGQNVDLRAVGRELGVKAVLTGRIQQRKEGLAISVELADSSDSRHLWGEQVTRPAAQLLSLQDSIAQEITQNLGRELSPAERQAFDQARIQTSGEAYQLYLKGRFYADKWTPEDVQRGLGYFDQALQIDPKFALAHAGKAYAYWGLSNQFMPAGEAMAIVKGEAKRALDLDPNLAEAHTALGMADYIFDHDFPSAEKEFKRGIELNPGSAVAYQSYGYFLVGLNRRREALENLEKAKELDPRAPEPLIFLWVAHYMFRDYAQALSTAKQILALEPDFWWGHLVAGVSSLSLDQPKEGFEELDKAMGSGSNYALAYRSYFLGRAGRREEGQKAFEQLLANSAAQKGFVSPYYLAMAAQGQGQTEQVLKYLDKAVTDKDEGAILLQVDPAWDSLRDKPAFQKLVAQVGLQQP